MTAPSSTPSCNAQEDTERGIRRDARLDSSYGPATPSLTNRIRDLRRERKWSLRRLSEITGIPINALWRMEKGGLPMLDRAFHLASAFQLTIYDLWHIPAPVTRAPEYLARLPDRMKVRAFRNACGWRLADLARATGIPTSTLSEVERGASPNLKNAVRIAVTLGVSVHELWSGRYGVGESNPKRKLRPNRENKPVIHRFPGRA